MLRFVALTIADLGLGALLSSGCTCQPPMAPDFDAGADASVDAGTDAGQPRCPTIEILETFAHAPSDAGAEPTMASAVITDTLGNYFYSSYVGAGYTEWLVRKSADRGQLWTTSEEFHLRPDNFNYVTSLFADPEGRLFASGVVTDAQTTKGHLRVSHDQGVTWSEAYTYLMPGAVTCKTYDVRSFGSGLVFTLGRCASGAAIHWLIRRSLDGAMTWTDVDFPHASEPYISKALHMVRAPNGDFVVFGFLGSAEGDAWLFRKSSDNGTTWSDLASVHTQPGDSDEVGSLTLASTGDLFAAGWSISPDAGVITGMIRRSSDNGATWVLSDAYQLNGQRTLYNSLVEDSRGRLFALAAGADPIATGMLRISRDHGLTWSNHLALQNPDGGDAAYSTLSINTADELLISGRHGDSAVILRVDLKNDQNCP